MFHPERLTRSKIYRQHNKKYCDLIVLAAGNSSRIYKKIKMMKFLIKLMEYH